MSIFLHSAAMHEHCLRTLCGRGLRGVGPPQGQQHERDDDYQTYMTPSGHPLLPRGLKCYSAYSLTKYVLGKSLRFAPAVQKTSCQMQFQPEAQRKD